jgi:hypothetical protein
MPEIRYKRLTRSRPRGGFAVAFQTRSSLWLGPDHLLGVDTTGYTENYKRFYFSDIQAITVRETTRRGVWNGVLGVAMSLCLVGFLVSVVPSTNPTASVVWGIFTVLFFTPFLINNLRGPTCVSQLRTAVQIEELPSLSRVRQTRRVLAAIRPFIAAAQGGPMPPEAVLVQMRDWAAAAEGAAPADTAPDVSNVPPQAET